MSGPDDSYCFSVSRFRETNARLGSVQPAHCAYEAWRTIQHNRRIAKRLAVANSTPNKSTIVPSVPVVILGTDALLAAAPATPVQLAHACLRGGFANVIPASWGDELIASAVL